MKLNTCIAQSSVRSAMFIAEMKREAGKEQSALTPSCFFAASQYRGMSARIGTKTPAHRCFDKIRPSSDFSRQNWATGFCKCGSCIECSQTCLFISHVNPSTRRSSHLRRPIQTHPGSLASKVHCVGSMKLVNSFFGNRFSLFFAIALASVTLAGAQQQQTDTTPPTTPTNLTATAVSSSQINLSWASSTDPNVKNQSSGVKGYNVYRGGSLLTFVTTTSMTDSGLSA